MSSSSDSRSRSRVSRYWYSLRPWSLPISFVSALVAILTAHRTSADQLHTQPDSLLPFLSLPVFLSFVLLFLVHSFGNLSNTYFDYRSGLDLASSSEDRGLVDRIVSIAEARNLLFALGVSIAITVSCLYYSLPVPNAGYFLCLTAAGVSLAFAYTGSGFKLKYKGLGDLVIFLCWGPLIMLGCEGVVAGRLSFVSLVYSLPVGLSVTAIVHANNARDVKADRKGGAVTVAQLLGEFGSYLYFILLYAGNLLLIIYLAVRENSVYLLLPLLSSPVAIAIASSFKQHRWEGICEKCAQYATLNGILFAAGLAIDKQWNQ